MDMLLFTITRSRLETTPTTEHLAILAQLGSVTDEQRALMPGTLIELREKLSQKAKQQPRFRFYALYDRIYRIDVLQTAWRLVRRNNGAPGVDRLSFEQIENSEGGVDGFVQQLQDQLRDKRYRAQGVRRHYIDKPDGGRRPLGIPTISDRVVQMAVLLIIGPIFEADFLDCSYGFRASLSAHQALQSVAQSLREGYRTVYDADIEAFFDTIPHQKLMAAVKWRISDGAVLRLIEQWLRAEVIEPDGSSTPRSDRGTPQGGVLSPLLANVYLHWFDTAFHRRDGPAQQVGARLVRYADDFVVLLRGEADAARQWIESLLSERFALRINPQKTRVVELDKAESFDFLGYTFRYDADLHGRPTRYLNMTPSKRSANKARERIRQLTSTRRSFVPIPIIIGHIGTFLRGWRGYFSIGYPRATYRDLNSYVVERLRIHLNRRSQRSFRMAETDSHYALAKRNGLLL